MISTCFGWTKTHFFDTKKQPSKWWLIQTYLLCRAACFIKCGRTSWLYHKSILWSHITVYHRPCCALYNYYFTTSKPVYIRHSQNTKKNDVCGLCSLSDNTMYSTSKSIGQSSCSLLKSHFMVLPFFQTDPGGFCFWSSISIIDILTLDIPIRDT